jgi:hypothetical protein
MVFPFLFFFFCWFQEAFFNVIMIWCNVIVISRRGMQNETLIWLVELQTYMVML